MGKLTSILSAAHSIRPALGAVCLVVASSVPQTASCQNLDSLGSGVDSANPGSVAPGNNPPPASPNPQAAPPVDAVEPGPVDARPSRFVGEEIADYTRSVAAVFAIRGRPIDPFGQFQDPDAKPAEKPVIQRTAQRAAPEVVVAFADMLRNLEITTIMPGERRFLVGNGWHKRGDILNLSYRGKNLRVQIVEVTARRILFRNLDTGETATRELDLLPAGMSTGQGGLRAPGMVPSGANAPIILEPESPESRNP